MIHPLLHTITYITIFQWTTIRDTVANDLINRTNSVDGSITN